MLVSVISKFRRDAKSGWLNKGGVFFLLILFGILLSACQDEKPPPFVSIQTALPITGSTPYPTIVRNNNDMSFDVVIFGVRDYHPANPNETINFSIINKNSRSIFISNCDGIVLQRKQDDTKWTNIAPARPCPPTGGQYYQIGPFSDPVGAPFIFSHHTTIEYPGQSWDVPGTYRLYLTYYLTCPNGSMLANDCIDGGHYASTEFQVLSGMTVTIAPNPNYTPGASDALPPTATPTQ